MNLTKKMQALLSLTALSALIAMGILISPAPEVLAASCHPHVSTFAVWGSGSSCAAATADLNAQGQAKATLNCSYVGSTPCTVSTTPTNSCYVQGGMWKIDGSVSFQCNNI